jgi:hypothetical protein
MRPDELETTAPGRLDALGPAPRAELLHVLMLPDFESPDPISLPICTTADARRTVEDVRSEQLGGGRP